MTHSVPNSYGQTVCFTGASLVGAFTGLAEEYFEGKCFSNREVNSAWKLLVCSAYIFGCYL